VTDGRLKLPKGGKFDVTLKLADGSEYASAGKVDFTDVRVNTATGTIEARAVVANRKHVMRPGQFARVVLTGAVRPGAIIVPQRAVLEGPGSKMVMTVNGQGLVEARPVEVGDWTGDEWVITKGLAPGDTVIVDGVVKARPGSPVTIANAPAGPAPPAGGPPHAEAPAAASPAASHTASE
jgi:membrane fusion protein (multidrug efflux system)